MSITAAIDGSALGNPGPAGWAWVVSDDVWAAGGWPNGTNNIGELTALVRLLEDSAEAGFADQALVVLADSQYVINSVTKWMPGWKRKGWRKADGSPVANREIMESIDRAMAGRDVRFEWVKGHSGHDMNEQADLRARGAAEAYRDGRSVPGGPGFTQMFGSQTAWKNKKNPRLPQQSEDSSNGGSPTDPIVAISSVEAVARWEEVLRSARVEPVTITEPGRPSLLLMDADMGWRALATLEEPGDQRLF